MKRKRGDYDCDDLPEFCPPALAVGHYVMSQLSTAAAAAASDQLSFLCVDLSHPRLRRRPALSRSELMLPADAWSEHIIAALPRWLDWRCTRSRQAALVDLRQAMHLGLQAVLLPRWRSAPDATTAATISDLCAGAATPQLWLCIDVTAAQSWAQWHWVRSVTGHAARLSPALELRYSPQRLRVASTQLRQWVSEDCRAVLLPTRFFSGRAGGPLALRADVRALLRQLLVADLHVLLVGQPAPGLRLRQYVRVVERLHARVHAPPPSRALALQQRFNSAYRDSLRSPLDPLAQNLDANTYRVMELDPVKYRQYRRAIQRALRDQLRGAAKGETLSVAVIGPGRGPLVLAALKARDKLSPQFPDLEIRVVALEKNEQAIVTLRNRFRGIAGLDIIAVDARRAVPSVLPRHSVHVMVSELLGSWADNEACPECLWPLQEALAPTGVMIPAAYRSFTAPITAARLWRAARDLDNLQSPYVVHMPTALEVAPAQLVFQFAHPQTEEGTEREATLSFLASFDAAVHGFAGFFDCRLYDDIGFSTLPETHSEGMFSWFPLYLPLQSPVLLTAQQELTVHLRRRINSERMWYEWCVLQPQPTAMHNCAGVFHHVRL